MMDHLNLHKILITNYKRKKDYYFHKMHKLKITTNLGVTTGASEQVWMTTRRLI